MNGSYKIWKAGRTWTRCHWWASYFLLWVLLKEAIHTAEFPEQLSSEDTNHLETEYRSIVQNDIWKYVSMFLNFQISSLTPQMTGISLSLPSGRVALGNWELWREHSREITLKRECKLNQMFCPELRTTFPNSCQSEKNHN